VSNCVFGDDDVCWKEVLHPQASNCNFIYLSIGTLTPFTNYSHSYDTTDKNKRIMERLKWRKPSVISRRLEIAFGPDIGPDNVGLFKRLSKKIWRDQKVPPPLPAAASRTTSRGTKRKASGGVGTGGASAPERARNVRSRHSRDNLA
jgi:hypothetical protein